VHCVEEFLAKKSTDFILNFGLGAELLNFAAFSLSFDARKNISSVLDR